MSDTRYIYTWCWMFSFGNLHMSDFVEFSYQFELGMQKQIFDMTAINSRFDDLSRMYDHIAEFGIDNTFLRIYNRDNTFSDVCKVEIPSCENLHESPESGLVIAAMEGIGEFFKNIIDFITGIFEENFRLDREYFRIGVRN